MSMKTATLHLRNKFGYEDVKTATSALATGSKAGGQSSRPLPSVCAGSCSICFVSESRPGL